MASDHFDDKSSDRSPTYTNHFSLCFRAKVTPLPPPSTPLGRPNLITPCYLSPASLYEGSAPIKIVYLLHLRTNLPGSWGDKRAFPVQGTWLVMACGPRADRRPGDFNWGFFIFRAYKERGFSPLLLPVYPFAQVLTFTCSSSDVQN